MLYISCCHLEELISKMPRILFVATVFSPLAARWIRQLADTEWDVHVFGTHNTIHPLLRAENITVHVYAIGRVENEGRCYVREYRDRWPFVRGRYRIRKLFPLLSHLMFSDSSEYLLKIIRNIKPDFIHSLKMQNEVYMTFDAFQKLPISMRPKWIYSVWGSDIYLNRHLPDHIRIIETVLPDIDYLFADNPRDIDLALEHGFQGVVLGIMPTGGGYPIHQMRQKIVNPPSKRRVIAIKGYQGLRTGQVITALEAIKLCGAIFSGYCIVIHSAIGTYASGYIDQVRSLAQEVSVKCQISIQFLPYSPPDSIWELLAQSRIHLAISKSDGTPNAMLEAMAVGAFPIQSDTGGLESWIESGKNGYLVPYDDVNRIAEAIIHALKDDHLVDQAAIKNYALTEERLDYDKLRDQVLNIYNNL